MKSVPPLFDVTSALQRRLQWHASWLLLMALCVPLMIPLYPVAKTGLAAHVIGITGALLLLAVSWLLPVLRWTSRQRTASLLLLVISVHLGFLTQWAGAFGGLSRMFIVTAAGRPEGHPILESVVEVLIKGITPTTLIAVAMLIYGLRGSVPAPPDSNHV
jgi:(hydroxyamino)benzene mutase